MLASLDGKVAVITGAGSGIGAALVRACAAQRMKVVAADVNRERVETVVDSLAERGSARAVVVDVADPASVDRLAAETYDTFGGTHLLCNNAGVSPVGMVWEFTPDDWHWLLGVKVLGVANGIRSFVPRMIASGEPGHIMNTGSGGSFQGQAVIGAYASTKHAILGLTDSLRHELADHDIGVTLLCPGGVNTNIVESMKRPSSTDDDKDIWAYITTMMADNDEATNTMIEPDHVAELALWGIQQNLPYVICAPGQKARVEQRFGAILDAHDTAARHDPRLP
jgi:NAD(P)-dependent dehydrogenase (short-subunit alcohol dehydrogenase family)